MIIVLGNSDINRREFYVMQWKCAISGKAGTSSIALGKEEAERLALELNRDTSDLRYDVVCVLPTG